MKRIVYDDGYVSPPGVLELLEVYPTQEALDKDEAFDGLSKTYAEMWGEAMTVDKGEA